MEILRTGFPITDAALADVAAGRVAAADFLLLQAVKCDFALVARNLRQLARLGLPASRMADAVSQFARAVSDVAEFVSDAVLQERRKGGDNGKN